LARLEESIAAFNQRFIFPLPFAMKIIKINLWNQGNNLVHQGRFLVEIVGEVEKI
jgi:hypothetical protein